MTPENQPEELAELWALVDELAALSERLCRAADAAMTALGKEGSSSA